MRTVGSLYCILHIPTYIITFGPLANPKQRLPSGFFNMRDYVVYVAFKIFQFSITIIHAIRMLYEMPEYYNLDLQV